MHPVFQAIGAMGVVPVIKIEDVETAVDLAAAIQEGGLHTIEVTVRNETAYESITRIKKAFPEMLVGAGTILNAAMAEQAAAAGVDYIVAPGLSIKTVEYCQKVGMPILPGCVTPTEIQAAMDLGLDTLKFFPADSYGGVATLKNLSGPFPGIRFVPTGGIGFHNMEEYLSCKAVAAIGGSFMAKGDVIAAHDWDTIIANCRRCAAVRAK